MKKMTSIGILLGLLLCLGLAGCGGGQGADGNVLEDDAAMAECDRIAAKAAGDYFAPTSKMTQTRVAYAKSGGNDVVVYRIDIPNNETAVAGFIAVDAVTKDAFYSVDTTLEEPSFKALTLEGEGDAAKYVGSDQAAKINKIEMLPGVTGTEEPGFTYAIGTEGLKMLRDTTWADWEKNMEENYDWGKKYAQTMLSFFADARIGVPGTYSTSDKLFEGILNSGNTDGDKLVFTVACEVMGLEADADYYYSFIGDGLSQE
ncbi:hypothetical protein LJB76_03020 [Clostridia bacterium OttesenSCG-928-O13]|nr:hypothetical protein [Clostridia bacterium OttesenSCG-928-O13]